MSWSRVICVADLWEYLEWVVAERLKNNKTKRHIESKNDIFEWEGVLGEIVVRRYLGLEEKLHTHLDNGIDLEENGNTFDMKGTQPTHWGLKYYHLQWPVDKTIVADYIVHSLVWKKKKQGMITGYTTRKLMARAPINFEQERPCREISIMKLKSYKDLFRLVGKSAI